MDSRRIEMLRKQAQGCGGCPIRLSGKEVAEMLEWRRLGQELAAAARDVLPGHRPHEGHCVCAECMAWDALERWDNVGGRGQPPEAKKIAGGAVKLELPYPLVGALKVLAQFRVERGRLMLRRFNVGVAEFFKGSINDEGQIKGALEIVAKATGDAP